MIRGSPAPLVGGAPNDGERSSCRVSVTAVIIVAMFISSSASITGGLFMYYESLASLENTVRETSEVKASALAHRIHGIVYGVREEMQLLVNTLYTSKLLDDEPVSWAYAVQSLVWAFIKASPSTYGVGIALVPPRGEEDDYSFFGMWVDPLRNGSSVISYGMRYQPDFAPPAHDNDGDGKFYMPILVHRIDTGTSELMEETSRYSNSIYLDYANDLARYGFEFTNASARQSELDHYAERRRGAAAYRSPDLTLYSYSGWDRAYFPPPAPHPWSRFRAVQVVGWYVYSAWKQPVEEYRRALPDTTIVIVDTATYDVYATTTGEDMVDQECFDERNTGSAPWPDCATKLHNMSALIQDAYHTLTTSDVEFRTLQAGGVEHFGRIHHMWDDVVMLWLQPTASVESKVSAALVVLVVFSVCVFLFDATLAAFELLFVGVPLKSISASIVAVGNMDTAAARQALSEQQGKVQVSEMHTLVAGMLETIRSLEEYRSFLPQTIVDHVSQDADGCRPDVAIVFTDIKASTRLWEGCPAGMAHALEMHNDVVRRRVDDLGGYEVKTIGDSFMLAFEQPEAAVIFGLEVQTDLVKTNWPPALLEMDDAHCSLDGGWRGLVVRVGINYGSTEQRSTNRGIDYFGSVVNAAARVEAAAIPGAVTVTDAVLRRVSLAALGHPLVFAYGQRQLRGFSTAVTLTVLVPMELKQRTTYIKDEIESRLGELQTMTLGEGGSACSDSDWHSDHVSRESVSSRSSEGTTSVTVSTTLVTTSRTGRLDRSCVTVGRTTLRFNGPDGENLLMGDANPQERMTEALVPVFEACRATRGVICAVHGSSVFQFWPGGLYGSGIVSHVRSAITYIGSLHTLNLACRVYVGLASGTMLFGTVGHATQRFVSAYGPCTTLADQLCEAAQRLDVIALYASLAELSPLKHPIIKRSLRPVDEWQIVHPNRSGDEVDTIRVFEVNRTGLVRYQIRNDISYEATNGEAEQHTGAFSHAAVCWDAFNQRDPSLLAAAAEVDPVVATVKRMMEEDSHLREPTHIDRY